MKELYTRIIKVIWEVTMHSQGVSCISKIVGILLCLYSKVGSIMGCLGKSNSVAYEIQSILCCRHVLHQADTIFL